MASQREEIFESDVMTRRERVEATLNHQPVDRAALHEQLSYNGGVIEMYTGKRVEGFDFTLDDICTVVGRTLDMCFPPAAPRGRERITTGRWPETCHEDNADQPYVLTGRNAFVILL